MIGLFFASVLAGIVAGAPFGAAGALVADAALVHDVGRLKATILAVVAGDSLLAFLLSLASSPVKTFLKEYEAVFFMAAGGAIIIMGFIIWRTATFQDVSIGKIAGPLSVFFITLCHPGSIATFLFIVALFSMHFPAFKDHRSVFMGGIAVGSFCVFSPVGILFWMLRKKAERFVRRLRYGLAGMLAIAGAYLLIKGF